MFQNKVKRADKSETSHFLNDSIYPTDKIEVEKVSKKALWGFMMLEAYLAYQKRTGTPKSYMDIITSRYDECATKRGIQCFLQDLSDAECFRTFLGEDENKYVLGTTFDKKDTFLGMQTLDNGISVFGVLQICKKQYYAVSCALIYYDGEKLGIYVPVRGNTVHPEDKKCILCPKFKTETWSKCKTDFLQPQKQTIKIFLNTGYHVHHLECQSNDGGIYWPGIKEDAELTFVSKSRMPVEQLETPQIEPREKWKASTHFLRHFLFHHQEHQYA